MRLRTLLGVGVAACVMILTTTRVLSQEKQAQKAGPPEKMQMDPEMAAWMKAATPGPNHELLNYCVGTWDATTLHWAGPDTPPDESKATCTNKWVLGRRYIETRFEGQAMGMPFEGIGYAGYDNVKKTFVSVWIDSMGTGIMTEEGTYNAADREFTYRSEFPSPTGEIVKSKTVVRVVNNDKHVMTMYHGKRDSAEMVKSLEITYTRAESDNKAAIE